MPARVSTLPELSVTAGGQPLPTEALRELEKMRVSQRLSSPAQCELTFSAGAQSELVAGRLAPGVELTVGVSASTATLFAGQVTAAEYLYSAANRQTVRVRAYDKLHRLRKRQKARSFERMTAAAVAQELCADIGLSVDAPSPGPEYPWLIQGRQTDWQFLLQLAERGGLYLSAREDTLHLLTLEGSGDPIALSLGDTLFEVHFELNGDAACRSVAAQGWHPARVEVHKGQASAARSGRSVSAEVAPGRVGADSQRGLFDEIAAGDDHAGALAQADLDRRAALEVVLWGAADGDPRLCPGALVDISGVAPSVAGRYVLAEAIHTIDRRMGYTTEVSSALPAPAARSGATIATPGVVSQIDDPENLGRVRVTLPTYDDVETDWMGVLTPGAGSGKGVIALPDTGDHVLVLLAHEDPAQGIVLGGLYGVVEPPDTGLDAGARRRFTFVTPTGQIVRLDDAAGTLRLQNQSGSYLDLTPDSVRLHATVDLAIEAPGKQIAISAAAINFNTA